MGGVNGWSNEATWAVWAGWLNDRTASEKTLHIAQESLVEARPLVACAGALKALLLAEVDTLPAGGVLRGALLAVVNTVCWADVAEEALKRARLYAAVEEGAL